MNTNLLTLVAASRRLRASVVGRAYVLLVALLALPAAGFAQSQAANGSIEGTIVDASGAALPGVTVTVTGVETGATRAVVTNRDGVYRAPLLPLGRYGLVAELAGFKTFESFQKDWQRIDIDDWTA
ncbi:MAG: hypothetical protein GEU99_13065 [Luteitalea sp.]|nr:hypothetical protein [Luteitalea sp.]